MKGKVNTFIYFLASRLQITSGERTLVLALGGLLILVSGSRQVLSADAQPRYSSEDYSERVALFQQRAERAQEELASLQQQYYPDTELAMNAAEPDGQPTALPERSEEPDISAQRVTQSKSSSEQESPPVSQEAKININTATSEQLESLPGIGPAIAARIIEYRETNGPFERIDDIKNVRGIAEGRFADIADLITTGNEPED